MESSGQGQSSGGKKPDGFSRFVRKASKALKPKSNRGSIVSDGSSAVGAGSPNAQEEVIGQSTVKDAPTSSAARNTGLTSPTPKPRAPVAREAPTPQVEVIRSTPTTAAAHFRLQEEKARALFAKYDLALEPGEWTTTRAAGRQEWVEKQVRIRVHRSCHRCENPFGTEKTCSNCSHTRCKKCPRHPKKNKDHNDKSIVQVLVDSNPKYQAIPRRAKPVPTMMSKGGQEMVRKAPTQRARRTCHKCELVFEGKATVCAGCKHQRCPKCPREPAKTKKWPNGYPGDVEETFPMAERTLKTIRHRVRWECHDCNKTFIEHERVCRGCKHERCEDCQRYPPKKVKHDPHPDVIRSLEEKLARTQLSPAA